jgi:GDP-4-dehydro-6-deoxy-D-mannose reductase
MRIFVTGATGFAGSHLVDLLISQDHRVFGLVHSGTGHLPLPSYEAISEVAGDLLDQGSIKNALDIAKPELVFHLAGQASPRISWSEPQNTFDVNTLGVVNLLQAIEAYGRPQTVIVTSADMYSDVQPAQLPITEQTCPSPIHPYGISKLAAGQLVGAYWRQYNLPVIEARPFNHIGPRQNLGFVVPDFASQLGAISNGNGKSEIIVGNLDVFRDFTDVRDVVRAYFELAVRGIPGESYLICSGQAIAIRELLDTLIKLSGLNVKVRQNSAQSRPTEIINLLGSYEKINRDTGWLPEISLETSLSDALEDWLGRQA